MASRQQNGNQQLCLPVSCGYDVELTGQVPSHVDAADFFTYAPRAARYVLNCGELLLLITFCWVHCNQWLPAGRLPTQ